MATLVQSANAVTGTNNTTAAVTYSSATKAGNLLIAAFGLDKTAGTITGPTGFTAVLNNSSASVSIWVGYKIADGTETTVTLTRGTTGVSGDTAYVQEWSDVASGPWFVSFSATDYTNETNVTTWASGTTSTVTLSNGLALAWFAIDSTISASGGQSFSNSYTTVRTWTGSSTPNGGAADIACASLATTVGGTTSSSETHSPTADQVSAGIFVIGRDVGLAGIGTSARPQRDRLPRGTRGQRARAFRPIIVATQPVWVPQSALRDWHLFARRRGTAVTPVPAQQNPPKLPSVSRPDWRSVVRSRGRAAVPVPGQDRPPVTSRPRWRWRIVRPGRPSMAAPPQQNPPKLPSVVRPEWRSVIRLRGRTAAPVPAQVIVVPPPYPPGLATAGRRWRSVRRGTAVTPVPAQQNPPRLPDVSRPDWRSVIRSRGRWSAPVPPQVFLGPPPTQRTGVTIRRLVLALRRGRVSQAAPPQVFQGPAYPPQRTSPRHPIEASARRRGSSGPPMPQIAPPAATAAIQPHTTRRRLIGVARARTALGRWIGVPRVITGMQGTTSGPVAAGSTSGPQTQGGTSGPSASGATGGSSASGSSTGPGMSGSIT